MGLSALRSSEPSSLLNVSEATADLPSRPIRNRPRPGYLAAASVRQPGRFLIGCAPVR